MSGAEAMEMLNGDEEDEENTLIQDVRQFVKRVGGSNGIMELNRDGKMDVIRILRKSRDFRKEEELETLRDLMSHIDFPSCIRSPGIDQAEETLELCRLMYVRKVEEASYVYRPNDEANTVFIVLNGEVDVDEGIGTIGGDLVSFTATPGLMFGEKGAGGGRKNKERKYHSPIRTGMATARCDTDLICIDREDIERQYMQQVFDESTLMQERYMRDATGHLSGYFQGWEFIKELEGIRVYKKTNLARGTVFFKGIGFIDKPHGVVSDYILNFDNRRDWDPLYMYGKTFEELDTYNILRYTQKTPPHT